MRCARAIYELYETPTLTKVIDQVAFPPPDSSEKELLEFLRSTALTDHHPSSSCGIGPVLDPHLRVHGVENLRVCDASVLPNCPRANTNLPTMMVAERFVELLDEEDL
jgi:choline dehydrogenase-like flavoprotein